MFKRRQFVGDIVSFLTGTAICVSLVALQEFFLEMPVISKSLPWCVLFGGGLGFLLYRRHLQRVRTSAPLKQLEVQVEAQNAELVKVYQQLATLYEIGHTITASLNFDEALNRISRSAAELLGSDAGAILLLDEDGQTLRIKGAHGLSRKTEQGTRDFVGENIAGRVAQTGTPLVVNDLPNNSRFRNPAAEQEGLLACVSVPLRIGSRIIGTLDVHSKTTRQAFNESHLQLLEMLATQAVIAIENARLYERLEQINSDLERRVEERTEALMLANDQLAVEIDERQRTETLLAQERNLLRTLLNHLPDSIYIKNTQSQFLMANPATANIIGVKDASALIGKNDFDIHSPEAAQIFYQDEQQILQTGVPMLHKEEQVLNRNSGKMEWILTSKIPFRDHSGKMVGIVGIGRDITEQKRTQEQLRRYTVELELLNQMYERLQSCQTEQETHAVFAQTCQQFFPNDGGGLLLFQREHEQLTLMSSWGAFPEHGAPCRTDDCPMFAQNSEFLDTPEDAVHACCYNKMDDEHTCVCMPIHAREQHIGVLALISAHAHQEFNLAERQTLMARIVAQYALSLSNLQLRERLRLESIRDALTGLYNRRYMESALERQRQQLQDGQTVAIIMLDIDHFKRFNDTYGHEAGDAVLRALGQCLMHHARSEDIACRYGGEEFMLILSRTSLPTAITRAEQIWQHVGNLTIRYQQHHFSLTISMGVAAFPEHGREMADVITAADKALYAAKEQGRNRVVVAPQPQQNI